MRTHSSRSLALLVAGAYFMENLDATIVLTSAPQIADSLGVRPVDTHVIVTAYLLTLGALIPVSRWVADRFGARPVFTAAIAIFTASSALCAASSELGMLVALRVVQGIGGAMMVPVGRLVVMRGTAKEDVIRAVAFLTWPALVAPVVAPVVGGLITTYASWRWLFLINLPLGVIGLGAALVLVPRTDEPRPPALDWGGFALSAIGLGLVAYAASLVDATRIDWLLVIALGAVGAAVLAASVRHLLRCAAPLIDLRVLRIPTVRRSALGGSVFRMAVSAVPFLLPLLFQVAFGWSAVTSGLMVMFVFIGNIAIKPLTTPALQRLGFRTVMIGSGAGLAATLVCCAFLTSHTPIPLIAVVLVLSGVFRSVGFTAYNTLAFADSDPATLGHVNTLMATLQQLMGGLGIAAGAVAVRAGAGVVAVTDLPDTATAAYGLAFAFVAVLAVLAIADARRLDKRAGASIGARAR